MQEFIQFGSESQELDTSIGKKKFIDYQVSEEVDEIITSVPAWIISYGTILILFIMIMLLILASLIKYPDVISTSLKVNSSNSPKAILAKQSGKLVKILVVNDEPVKKDQLLGYMESTADQEEVIKLSKKLVLLSHTLLSGNNFEAIQFNPESTNLGELQAGYQLFYQSYFLFKATLKGGHYLKQRAFIKRDLQEIDKLKNQIFNQQEIQQQEFANSKQEYEAYKKLMAKGVISINEFKQEENKYLASKHPIQQSTTDILNNYGSRLAKEKEILELDNTIIEQRAKFTQALNVIISEVEEWKMTYLITAPFDGTAMLVGPVQENQNVELHEELFIVNPGNTDFFGEINIPQDNMGKIVKGQSTLVKMKSYPFEQFGLIKGKISYLSNTAYRDSVFIARVDFDKFENKDPYHKIILKNGMVADAEIITDENSLLQRFTRNIIKMINHN